MSEVTHNIQIGIDGTSAPSGARVVKRSLDDINSSVDAVNNNMKKMESAFGMSGSASSQAAQQMGAGWSQAANQMQSSSNAASAAMNKTTNSAKEAASTMKLLGVSVQDLEAMFGRLLVRTAQIALIYGSINLIKSAISESLNYLGTIETAQLGIATAFLAGGKYIDQTTGKAIEGQRSLNIAQADSKDIVDQLRVANLKTTATLDQLVYAYQVTLPVAMAKGFNREQVKDYTLAMVQAAGAIGMSYNQIAEETRDMLQGTPNSRNTRIATLLGMTKDNQEYVAATKKGGQELYDYLMMRLKAYQLAGDETMKTWQGMWSNMKDIAKQGGGEAFTPLFNAIKGTLKEIQDYVMTIDVTTGKITLNPDFVSNSKAVGDVIKNMYSGLVGVTKAAIEYKDQLQAIGVLLAIVYSGKVMGDVGGSALGKAFNNTDNAAILAQAEATKAASIAEVANTQAKLDNAIATRAEIYEDSLLAQIKAEEAISNASVTASELALAEAKANTLRTRILEAESRKTLLITMKEESLNNMLSMEQESELSILKQKVNNDSKSRALLLRNETLAQEQLTSAQIENTAAIARQDAATLLLNQQQERLVGANNLVLASTLESTTAKGAAIVASNALVVAEVELNVATKALQTAFNAVGGWVTITIASLYLLYKAWEELSTMEETYKKESDERWKTSPVGQLDARIASAREEIKKLTQTPQQRATEEISNAQKTLDLSNQHISSLKEELALEMSRGGANATEDSIYQGQYLRIKAINDQLAIENKTQTELVSKTKLALEVEKQRDALKPKYEANKKPPEVLKNDLSKEKTLDNAYLSYVDAYYKGLLAMHKDGAATIQMIIDNAFKNREISQLEHIDKTRENQTTLINLDLAEIQRQKAIKQELFDLYSKQFPESILTNPKDMSSDVKSPGSLGIDFSSLGKNAIDKDKEALKNKVAAYAELYKLIGDINKLTFEETSLAERDTQNGIKSGQSKIDMFHTQYLEMEKIRQEGTALIATNQALDASLSFTNAIGGFDTLSDQLSNLTIQLDQSHKRQLEQIEERKQNAAQAYIDAEDKETAVIRWLQVYDASIEETNLLEKKYAQDRAKIYWDTTAIGGMINAIQNYGKTADNTGKQVENIFTNAFKGIEDSLTEMIAHGKLSFTSFVESLRMDLARLASQKIILSFGASLGSSLFGTAATAATTAGVNGAVSTTAGTAGTAGLLGAGGLTSGLGSFGAEFGAGYSGGMGMFASGSVAASMGAIAGVVAPIAIAAAGIYGIAKLGFGVGNTYQKIGSGYDLTISGNEVSGQTWEEFKKKGGWFTSDTYRYKYKILSDNQAIALQNTLDTINNSLAHDADIMGKASDVTTSILNETMNIGKTNTSDEAFKKYTNQKIMELFPEIGQMIEQFTTQLSDGTDSWGNTIAQTETQVSTGMAYVVGKLSRTIDGVIEDATATATRIFTAIDAVQLFFAQTGQAIASITLEQGNNASALMDKFGGVDKFTTATTAYAASSVFTAAEQTTNKFNTALLAVNNTFQALNLDVPQTNDAFKNLVNSTLQTAMAGGDGADAAGNLYVQLLAVSEAFGLVHTTATAATDALDAAAALQKTNDNLTVTLLELQGKAAESLALKRQLETAGMDASTLKIQTLIYTLQDLATAADVAASKTAYQVDITSRLLHADSSTSDIASIYDLTIKQIKELNDAMMAGYDTTQLVITQQMELNNLYKEQANLLAKDISSAIDLQKSLINAILDVQAIQTSPEEAYKQATDKFNASSVTDLPSTAKALLEASKAYNASGVDYQNDLKAVLDRLNSAAGYDSTPTVDIAQSQLNKLEEIRAAVEKGDTTQIANLSSMIGQNASINSLLATYLQTATGALQAQQAQQAAAAAAAQAQQAAVAAAQQAAAAAAAALQVQQDRQTSMAGAGSGARVFMGPNDSYNNVNNGSNVFGSSGNEVVNIAAGIKQALIDQNVERVNLTGAVSSYLFKQQGNSLAVFEGSNLIAQVALQGDANGTQFGFAGASPVNAMLNGSGQMTLGGKTITDYLNIPAFASGGITSGLSFAGEAGPEAVIPLPDGRNIPVRMEGSADNKETVAELKETNRQLAASIRVLQAGFNRLIDINEQQEKRLKGVESKTRMQAI